MDCSNSYRQMDEGVAHFLLIWIIDNPSVPVAVGDGSIYYSHFILSDYLFL